eukprot:m.23646 g.23646  ORF g.23646 m.23646 type:complete len:537 (+) comp28509_c0_seq2:103-1713(+)
MGFAGSYRTLLFLPLAASLFTEVAVAIRHHHTVFRSDFPVHALHRRRRDVSGNDTTSSEWPTETTVVNAIPGNENVTVVFPGRTFAVIYERRINDYFYHLPTKSERVLFVISRKLGGIRETFVKANVEESNLASDKFYFYTFNAFGPSDLGSKRSDVILFNPTKFDQGNASLYLVADNISWGHARFALLDSGDYEIKVVKHQHVADIHEFKNVNPIVPPLYKHFEAGKIYFLVLSGLGNHEYPPQNNIFPKPQMPKSPLPKPVTDVYVLNAYPDEGEVSVSFDTYDFQPISYGAATKGRLYLEKGDSFELTIDEDVGIEAVVNVNVPHVNGVCVVVPDSGVHGNLEVLFNCWDLEQVAWNKTDQAWVFTYNTIKNCPKLDVLFLGFKSSQLCAENCTRFYATAYDLNRGHGMFGVIDAGAYDVKVVSTGAVNDSTQFLYANAILDEKTIIIAPGVVYFSVMSGECNSIEFPAQYFTFPSFGRMEPIVPPERRVTIPTPTEDYDDVNPVPTASAFRPVNFISLGVFILVGVCLPLVT